MKKVYKRYFFVSVVFSLIIHIAAFFGLYKHFLSFYRNIVSYYQVKSDRMVKKITEDEILKVTFQKTKNSVAKREIKPFLEKKEIIKTKKDTPFLKLETIDSGYSFYSKTSKEDVHLIEHKKNNFAISKIKIQKDLIEDIKDKLQNVENRNDIPLKVYNVQKEESSIEMAYSDIDAFKIDSNRYFYFDKKKHEKDFFEMIQNLKEKSFFSFRKKGILLPFHRNFLSYENLKTISCGKDFSYEVEYIKKEDGYIFAVILIPGNSLEKYERIKQNFYFLFDCSNSIQNKRLAMTRHAINASLSNLHEEDSFNILAFDNKINTLYSDLLFPTSENIKMARSFLRKQFLGKFFHSTNFFLPLSRVLCNDFDKDKINNIILITNGDNLSKRKNYQALKKWTDINNFKFSLHSISMQQDKELAALDLFTFLNSGKSLASPTLRGIKRYLIKLVNSLKYPIAKDISIKVYSDNKIDLFYPKNSICLYLNQPLVILGSIDKKEDFTLFLQGKNKKKWFNMKKKISFSKAVKSGDALKEKIAQYEANKYYNDYLVDNDKKYLKKAKKILKPYDLKTAFQ